MPNECPTLEELMAKAKSLPDDKFPEWIFNITFHTYADCPNYWMDYDMSDPRAVLLNTSTKTKDVESYLEKHRIWKEYLEDISLKYGITLSMVPVMFKAGLIKEFVPEEPRLSKKSKAVKRFLKTGKLPFKQETEYKGVMKFYVDEMTKNAVVSDEYGVSFREPTKEEQEILNYAENQISAKKRIEEFRNPSVGRDARRIEFVGEYYKGLAQGFYDERPKIFTDEGVDIQELLRQSHEEEDTPDYIREDELRSRNGTIFYDGAFHTEDELNRRKINAAFAAAGVNPMVLYENGMMKKKEVYIASIQNGFQTDDVDEWEKKKRKKEKKKEKKLRKKHMRSLGSMASLLTQNGFTGGFDTDDERITGIDIEDYFKM